MNTAPLNTSPRGVEEVLADPATFVPCTKCGGSGNYTSPHTGGGGTCSVCYGKGRTFTKAGKAEYKAAKKAALEAKRAPLLGWIETLRTAAASLAEPPVAYNDDGYANEEYDAAHEAASFETKREWRTRELLESIADQAWDWGSVTDKQRAAADKVLAKLAEPPKVKVPVETGKGVVITGTIVSTKLVDNPFGRGSIEKMVVEDDRGFRVYGTLPSRLQIPCAREDGGCIVEEDKDGNETWFRYPDKGDRCSFKANVERSNDDESFGFYKRPTKVKAL